MAPTRSVWRRLAGAAVKLANAVAAASGFLAPGPIDDLAEQAGEEPRRGGRAGGRKPTEPARREQPGKPVDTAVIVDQPRASAALGLEPIRTIGRDELKVKLDRADDFKLVMALNRWAFEAKHIPGSLHFDTPGELYAALRPEDEIVVYCSNVDCLSSVALYRDLVRRGYRNVRRYAGGLLDWEDAGLPLDGEFATPR